MVFISTSISEKKKMEENEEFSEEHSYFVEEDVQDQLAYVSWRNSGSSSPGPTNLSLSRSQVDSFHTHRSGLLTPSSPFCKDILCM